MSILDDESNAEVISWLPEGKGFIILDKKRFAEDVMPRYFNDTKFASFIRRLNRWCFIHRPKGNCQSQYFHPWFVKGDLHKCLQIRPKPQVSYKKKKKAAEEAHAKENHEALFAQTSQSVMMPQQGSLGQGQMGQFMQSGLQNPMSAANAMHQNNLYPTFPRASNFDSASLMPSHGLGHNQMAASRIAGYGPVGFGLPTPQANPQYPQYIMQGGANNMPQLSNFSQSPMQRIMNLPEPRMPGLPSEPMNNSSMFNSSLRNPYDMRGMQGMSHMNRDQQFQPTKSNRSQSNEMQNLQFMANHQQGSIPLRSNSAQNNLSPVRGGAQYQDSNPQDRHNL